MELVQAMYNSTRPKELRSYELGSDLGSDLRIRKSFVNLRVNFLLFDRLTIKIILNYCYGVTSLLVTRHNKALLLSRLVKANCE